MHRLARALPSRPCLAVVALLLEACCCPAFGQSKALECPRDQVWIDGSCEPCPSGSTYQRDAQRLSGRTSGVTVVEHFCTNADGRVGPYARTEDDRWLIEGGRYDATGQKTGTWLEYPRYGYSDYQHRGRYENGAREGTWQVLFDGNVSRTQEYRDGELVTTP